MRRRPTQSPQAKTLFPYTTLFRSADIPGSFQGTTAETIDMVPEQSHCGALEVNRDALITMSGSKPPCQLGWHGFSSMGLSWLVHHCLTAAVYVVRNYLY